MSDEQKAKKEVVITIQGGWVQEVVHPGDVRVIVRDYDVAEIETRNLKIDEAGKQYEEEVW